MLLWLGRPYTEPAVLQVLTKHDDAAESEGAVAPDAVGTPSCWNTAGGTECAEDAFCNANALRMQTGQFLRRLPDQHGTCSGCGHPVCTSKWP